MSRVAVVTGGNRGIGFCIVKQLVKAHPDWVVYLTSRSAEQGQAALDKLKSEHGVTAFFHQLDIDSQDSQNALKDFLVEKHKGLDVLVNNAGIAYKQDSTAPSAEQAVVTNKTNYFATLALTKTMMPILRDHARVVNVASRVANMFFAKMTDEGRNKFRATKCIEDVDALVNEYVNAAQQDKLEGTGYPCFAYGISKCALVFATGHQQKLADSCGKADVLVNACCPGYCVTDMTGQKGNKTADEGAETPVYLATLPENATEPKGKFLGEKKILDVEVNWTP